MNERFEKLVEQAGFQPIVRGGLFFFDTEEEQYAFYRIFEQPLTDSSAIYACTYDASGVCQTENT